MKGEIAAKQFKLLSILLLLVLLVSALAGCSPETKPETETAGLPVLYIDGEAFPVTFEEGVRGLETLHGGVLSMHIETRYDTVLDSYKLEELYTLYRADGTVEEDYQGERKLALNREGSYVHSDSSELDLRCLTITAAGLPFSGPAPADASAFQALMEKNGFISLPGYSYLRLYTESGFIDMSTPEFREQMRERVRNSKDYGSNSSDSAWVEEFLDKHPEIAWSTANAQLIQAIRDGNTRFGCQLELLFNEESGEACTKLTLIAPQELLDDWYQKWSPCFGEEIRPGE